jgi:hypothetical protein
VHAQLSSENKTSVPWYIRSAAYGVEYPSSATLPHLPFTIYFIQLDRVNLSYGACKSNTSFTIELPNPKSSDAVRTTYEVAYKCGVCTPISTLKSAIERAKRREKGEKETRKRKNSRSMTTNSRKGDRYPCSEHYGLSNRKEKCQCQREGFRSRAEDNATVGARTRYDPRAPNEDLAKSQDSDGGIHWDYA